MINRLFIILFILIILSITVQTNAQNIVHEIGLGVGPVSFRGDYGERQDSETNLGNTGFGINLSHYLNFAYDYNGSYFKEHFKLRTHMLFQNINLKHYGRYAESSSANAAKLRAMYGEVIAFEVGTGLQWHYKNIKTYERYFNAMTPYAGFGLGAIFSYPYNDTSLPGNLGSVTNTFPTFLPHSGEKDPISNDFDSALTLNFQVGAQYRLDEKNDVFAELRWHFFNSDFIDGLSPIGNQNKSNDWSAWFSIGYVYYFDSPK